MVEPVQAKSKAEMQANKRVKESGGIVEIVTIIVQALLIALVVRTFLFQPFNIPSGSLIPTLEVGDYLFVSKYTYGYSRYSFPWGPNLFSGRVLGSPPKRGDIAVFKWPKDTSIDYIKRVIGLPGDKIRVAEGRLFINGAIVPRRQIGSYRTQDASGKEVEAPYYEETLPGSDPAHPEVGTVTHRIIQIDGDSGYYDNWPRGDDPNKSYEVPPGEFLMMGDNRDNSLDSRNWGPVPFENLVGRAEIIFFSIKTVPGQGEETEPAWQFWRWPWTVRWNRLFQPVR
ncbi:MAG: signal peptidase I [Methylobacteriaceae bacterium]|nr:signal peptidase I [Methylobacteriaceae bacterium]